jgi:penicillin-binding protein 1C
MLDILVPDNNTAIFIPKGIDGETGMVIFEAVHRKSDATIFWHLDENFVAQTLGMHKIEITPSVGNHVLTVQDEAGNTVRRKFRVK